MCTRNNELECSLPRHVGERKYKMAKMFTNVKLIVCIYVLNTRQQINWALQINSNEFEILRGKSKLQMETRGQRLCKVRKYVKDY